MGGEQGCVGGGGSTGEGQPLGPSSFSTINFLPIQRLNYRILNGLFFNRESVGAFSQSSRQVIGITVPVRVLTTTNNKHNH